MAPSGFFMKDAMTGRIALLGEGVTDRARSEMEHYADEIESYAQQNAPWDDRTGSARDGLVCEVTEEGGTLYLELAHTVDYGQWLEVIQSGRFAIIMPTLELFAGELFQDVGAHAIGSGGEE